MSREEYDEETDWCGSCGDVATHEVLPPNPDRDDYLPVCEKHANQLRPISAGVRRIDSGTDDE